MTNMSFQSWFGSGRHIVSVCQGISLLWLLLCVQKYTASSWNSTKELLWSEAEIRRRAQCASNYRIKYLSIAQRTNMERLVLDADTWSHKLRRHRYHRALKLANEDLNNLGMSDVCAFQELGYFRCGYSSTLWYTILRCV